MQLRSGKRVKQSNKMQAKIKWLKGHIKYYQATESVLRRAVHRLEAEKQDLEDELEEFSLQYEELYRENQELEQEIEELQYV